MGTDTSHQPPMLRVNAQGPSQSSPKYKGQNVRILALCLLGTAGMGSCSVETTLCARLLHRRTHVICCAPCFLLVWRKEMKVTLSSA